MWQRRPELRENGKMLAAWTNEMLIQCSSSAFVFIRNGSFPWFSPQNENLFGAPCLWITNHLFQNLHVFVCIIRMMSIYSMYSDVREKYPNRILLRAVPYRSSKWKSKPSHGMNICTSSKNLKTSTALTFVFFEQSKIGKKENLFEIHEESAYLIDLKYSWSDCFLFLFLFDFHFILFYFRKNPDHLSQNNGCFVSFNVSPFSYMYTFAVLKRTFSI